MSNIQVHLHAKDISSLSGQTLVVFTKANAVDSALQTLKHIEETQSAVSDVIQDPKRILSDVDLLTAHYAEGQRLFISQACYPCHRIAGFSRAIPDIPRLRRL